MELDGTFAGTTDLIDGMRYLRIADIGLVMTSLLFSEKEKQLIKKRKRVIKRNKKKNGFKLYEISDFKFSKPESESEPVSE